MQISSYPPSPADRIGASGEKRRYYVPGELDGAAAEVLLAGRARPLRPRVAVVGRRGALLLEAVAPREGPVGGGRPPAGGLVGGLAQERGDLALPLLVAARRAEGREGGRGGEEGVVGVEAARGARGVVAVEEEPLEEVPRQHGRHAGAAGGGAAGALALAAGAAVRVGGAAEAEAAAAEAVAAQRAAGLRPALLGARGRRRRGGGQDDAQESRRCRGRARGTRC